MKRLMIFIAFCFLHLGLKCAQREVSPDNFIGKEFYLVHGPQSLCKVRIEGYLGSNGEDLLYRIDQLEKDNLLAISVGEIVKQGHTINIGSKALTRCAFNQKLLTLKHQLEHYINWCLGATFEGRWYESGNVFPVYYGTVCDTTQYVKFWDKKAQERGLKEYGGEDLRGCLVCFTHYWLMDPCDKWCRQHFDKD